MRRRAAIQGWGLTLGVLAVVAAGCTLAPRRFEQVADTRAPLIRARAIGLGESLPDEQVVPELIRLLNDSEPVVRMTAHDGLKRRTGQDFGYRAWDEEESRAQAVARWEEWWRPGGGQEIVPDGLRQGVAATQEKRTRDGGGE